jgi:hypothetical protein
LRYRLLSALPLHARVQAVDVHVSDLAAHHLARERTAAAAAAAAVRSTCIRQ